jgi:hypothetical protein
LAVSPTMNPLQQKTPMWTRFYRMLLCAPSMALRVSRMTSRSRVKVRLSSIRMVAVRGATLK